jgi:hypothetical protein
VSRRARLHKDTPLKQQCALAKRAGPETKMYSELRALWF